MNTILHKITIETSPELLYQALTSQDGLSSWWTKTRSSEAINSFFFGPEGAQQQVDMEIKTLNKNKLVSWKCVAGPWTETGLFNFEIEPDERGAILKFSHEGWDQLDDFFAHCNSKWGFFLTVSLKNYLEKDLGQPHPNDPNI